MAVGVSFKVKSRASLEALIQAMPQTLSYALNDALFRTRDQMIVTTYVDPIKRAGGRKFGKGRQKESGRRVLRVKQSDPQNLSGDIYAEFSQQKTAERLARLSADELIRGFVTSTAPQFVGVSKKERTRQALGLYYRLKRQFSYQQKAGQLDTSVFTDDFNKFMLQFANISFPRRAKRTTTQAARVPAKAVT